ncbi:MAG: DUF4185 domain-containing protein [Rikenellaceae bacterium]|nr:DUF4185 domain-containing protein [Rikenellaceae bacterium]
MKKNLFYLFVAICTLSFFTACKDDDKQAPDVPPTTEDIIATYSGDKLTATVNGQPQAAGARVEILQATGDDAVNLKLYNLIEGQTEFTVPDVDFEVGTKSIYYSKLSGSTTDELLGLTVAVDGKVDEGVLTLAVTTTEAPGDPITNASDLYATYKGTMQIDVTGMETTSSEQRVYVSEASKNAASNIKLEIKNFAFQKMELGTISVDTIAVTKRGTNIYAFKATGRTLDLDIAGTPTKVNLDQISGTIIDGAMTLSLDLNVMQSLIVKVGFNGNVYDDTNDPVALSFLASVPTVTDGPALAWKAGDAISVFDSKGNKQFSTTASGEQAAFTGEVVLGNSTFSALYPYASDASLTGGKISVNIPATQEGVAGSYAPAGFYAVAYTKLNSTDDPALSFTNVPAFLKISLSEADGVGSVKITAKNGEKIAGAADVTIAEDIAVEAGTSAEASITLTGNKLNGTFYILAIPQTLSDGYTISMLNTDNDMMYVKEVSGSVELTANATLDLGTYSSIAWTPAVNPNPTTVPKLSLIQASFKEGEFNVLSEPGFENYPSSALSYRTNWRIDAAATAVEGHSGSVAVTLPNLTPGKFFDVAKQCVALRPNTDYNYSVWAKAGVGGVYNGVRAFDGVGQTLNEIKGPTWAPNDQWTNLALKFNSKQNFYGDVFAGIWGDPGGYFTVDDFKLIPANYAGGPSMDPSSASVLGTVKNTTFSEISSLGKAVMWKGIDGKLRIALSNITVNGTHYDNAIAITDAEDINGAVSIASFVKSEGALAPIMAPGDGETSIVPNAAFTLNGKTYLHYYAKTGDGTDANKWTASSAGFLVSEDDGKTWTKSAGTWSGTGCFVEAGFCQKDNYIYMAGSKAGRGGSGDMWLNMYVARSNASSDITDPTQWEYFDGTAWQSGNEQVCNIKTCCITVGCAGEPALVYNPKFNRFMMIYRSNVHGGIVYRDADAVDGYWSGEKILADDDLASGIFAPSVLEVTANGDLLMAVPQL